MDSILDTNTLLDPKKTKCYRVPHQKYGINNVHQTIPDSIRGMEIHLDNDKSHHYLRQVSYSLTGPLAYSLAYSLTGPLAYSLAYSLTHSLTGLLAYSLTRLLTHSLTSSYLLTHSLLLTHLTYSLTHSYMVLVTMLARAVGC